MVQISNIVFNVFKPLAFRVMLLQISIMNRIFCEIARQEIELAVDHIGVK